MTQQFSEFPSIEQFRNVIHDVKATARYSGMDEAGKPIYDAQKDLPTLTFRGTVKLHGTNAGVGYRDGHGVWAQSRSRVLLPGTDNQGFRAYVDGNADALEALCKSVPHKPSETVFVYGEWVGQGIQRGVAICQVSKRLVLFAAKVVGEDGEAETWLDDACLATLKDHDASVYNIHDYESWTVDIDFNEPQKSQQLIEQITDRVEAECPVGKAFGHSGIGEGVVWSSLTPEYGMMRFKVKGEKHAVTKAKSKAACKAEPSADAKQFVDNTVTDNRLEQAAQAVFGNEPRTMKKTSQFLTWMLTDIFKEESDTLLSSNLTKKQVEPLIRTAARTWLLAESKKV